MCGGELEIKANDTIATCEYCGSKQTLPKLNDDRKVNLYDRASHFRRNNEFDKAMGIYEQILNEDSTDAESYWSLVLCRYGIEYVEDPATRKRVPTVNRAQFTSIFDDENYKLAIQYADSYQRGVYEEEANLINEIQKGILSISQKEEPFDIFICYKETDNNGRRTQDSVLANDLYHLLTQEGFKVFFSRITLEDKLGSAYEPYIFAALNSSKIMVVLGTKPEYFKAVWVRNEWSRYLSLIKQGEHKILIPAYRDMDPYELPEEFSHLQAQDMSKLGFMQDLIRGIKKITHTDVASENTAKETVVPAGNIEPLLKRAFIFLEDEDWQSADEYCEKVLDLDPENAMAYVGKLLSELHLKNQEELKEQRELFDDNNNYKKAIRFADDELKKLLESYREPIIARFENAKLEKQGHSYTHAKAAMAAAKTEAGYKNAAYLFETIKDYQDSSALAQECYDKAEDARKDEILANARLRMNGEQKYNYEAAINLLKNIPGWKDADEKLLECQKKIEDINQKDIEEKKNAKLNKWRYLFLLVAVCVFVVAIYLLSDVLSEYKEYKKVVNMMDDGNYYDAFFEFDKLDGYKDSKQKMNECIKGMLKDANTGDVVILGSYEQDNNIDNGTEYVEWRVVGEEDGRILLISECALDCKEYAVNNASMNWEQSSLRSWLNNEFFDSAFSSKEQKYILPVEIIKDGDKDKAFLLSDDEINKYMNYDSMRICKPTAYASVNGAYISNNGGCLWWLRTAGTDAYSIEYVSGDGSVNWYGEKVNTKYIAVRPAIWIDLKALED